MATARRRFFPLYTTLYREAWPRDWKITYAMLGMLFTDRWAADRLTERQAERARLSASDLVEVTGCATTLESIEMLESMSVECGWKLKPLANGYTWIEWRKFSETLRSRRPVSARLVPGCGPAVAPSASASASASSSSTASTTEEVKSRPARKARGAPKTDPPDGLQDEEKRLLRVWTEANYPTLAPQLESMIEACLDWHRARGNRQADWVATCRMWFRNSEKFGDRSRASQVAPRSTNGSAQYVRRVQSEDHSETTEQDRADLRRIKAEIAAEDEAKRLSAIGVRG